MVIVMMLVIMIGVVVIRFIMMRVGYGGYDYTGDYDDG